MNENTPCVILLRESAQEDWKLLNYTHVVSVAISCAKYEAYQEWRDGNEAFETKVITDKDYHAGRLNTCIQRFTFASKDRVSPAPVVQPSLQPVPAEPESSSSLVEPPEGFDM